MRQLVPAAEAARLLNMSPAGFRQFAKDVSLAQPAGQFDRDELRFYSRWIVCTPF